jgi:putative endonuclease
LRITSLAFEKLSLPGLTGQPGNHQPRSMEREHNYFVYMLASRLGGTLYIGVTSDLAYRASLHREGVGSEFTAKYGVKRLVYYEHHNDIRSAIAREKRLKKWPRRWKIELIEKHNPNWTELFPTTL